MRPEHWLFTIPLRLRSLFRWVQADQEKLDFITSNRSIEEWMGVFDDAMLGQSALDRFCHRAHQFVIEGESYRKRTAVGSAPKISQKATS